MHLRFEYGSALFVGWAALVIGILGGVILCFTSVFIIMRLNISQRRQRPNATTNTCSRHQAHAHHTCPHDESGLTKKRVAQHNAKLNSTKAKHIQHNPNSSAAQKPSVAAFANGSRSSSDRSKRHSGEGPARPLSGEHSGASRRHHHHHMHSSKSEPAFEKRDSKHNEDDDRRKDGDQTNGFTRTRPAKEYV